MLSMYHCKPMDDRDLYFGDANQILKKKNVAQQPFAKQFRKDVKEAYVDVGCYTLKKFPLRNKVLMRLSAIDPTVHGHSETAKALKKLKEHFPSILGEEHHEAYDRQVTLLQADLKVPNKDLRVDRWWAELFPRYEVVGRVVKACLSIMTAPAVERNFSVMNDIITAKTSRLDLVTVNAILTVKASLKAKSATTISHYQRKDKRMSPVDKAVCYCIQSAWGRYQKRLLSKKSSVPIIRKKKKEVHEKAREIKRKILKRKLVGEDEATRKKMKK